MSWTRIPRDEESAVLIAVGKKTVTLTLCQPALSALGWSASWKVDVELGDGEHAGWVRIFDDENGIGSEASGHLALSLPRSTLPDLTETRPTPLVWRVIDGAIEARLPTVAARPKLRPVALEDAPRAVAVPERYASLHTNAWIAGVELVFLSNGTCLVNGAVVAVDEVEAAVRRRLEAA